MKVLKPFCFEFLYIFRKENLDIHETFMHQKKILQTQGY